MFEGGTGPSFEGVEVEWRLTVDRTAGASTFDRVDPFPYTDAHGRAWHVYDYHVVRDRKRALPINDSRAETRAFVPVGGGTVMVYEFGRVAYRTMEPKLVEYQLAAAKPLGATAGEPLSGTR